METKVRYPFSVDPRVAVCLLLCMGAIPVAAQVPGCGGPDGRSFRPIRGIQAQPMTFGQTSWLDQALCGLIYHLPPDSARLPDLSRMRSVGTIYTRELNFPVRNFEEGFPGITSRFEWFAIEYHGRIRAGRKGSYSLRLVSDDGSKLFIDGRLIVDNDGQHAVRSVSGFVDLDSGEHEIRIQYFQGPRYQIALQLFCTPEGGQERLFPNCGIQLETPTAVRTAADSRVVEYEVIDTKIHYGTIAEGDCRPSKAAENCTPNRAVVDASAWGQYHVLLPANLAVGIPNPGNLPLVLSNVEGSACWDVTLGGDPLTGVAPDHAGCNGPDGGKHVPRAGPGFLMPDKRPGALISWTSHGTTVFAVNGRIGDLAKDANGLSRFNGHEGAFAFDVQAAPPAVLGSLTANRNTTDQNGAVVSVAVTPYMVPIDPAHETWKIIGDSGNRQDLEKFARVYPSSEFRVVALSRAAEARGSDLSRSSDLYGAGSTPSAPRGIDPVPTVAQNSSGTDAWRRFGTAPGSGPSPSAGAQRNPNQIASVGLAPTEGKMPDARPGVPQPPSTQSNDLRVNLIRNPKLIPGAWYDASTDLLWTDKDNGKNVNWASANRYCGALRYGGFSDWRMATVGELSGLYDPSATRHTAPSLKGAFNATLNPLSSGRMPQSVGYHVRGDITLSEALSWSSDAANGRGFVHVAYFFVDGSQRQYDEVAGGDGRVLCVRKPETSESDEAIPRNTVAERPAPGGTPVVARGLYLCQGSVLLDIDAAMEARMKGRSANPPAQDSAKRVITAPVRIVDVDPSGMGMFRVEGSRVVYALSSGPPPQASCPR